MSQKSNLDFFPLDISFITGFGRENEIKEIPQDIYFCIIRFWGLLLTNCDNITLDDVPLRKCILEYLQRHPLPKKVHLRYTWYNNKQIETFILDYICKYGMPDGLSLRFTWNVIPKQCMDLYIQYKHEIRQMYQYGNDIVIVSNRHSLFQKLDKLRPNKLISSVVKAVKSNLIDVDWGIQIVLTKLINWDKVITFYDIKFPKEWKPRIMELYEEYLWKNTKHPDKYLLIMRFAVELKIYFNGINKAKLLIQTLLLYPKRITSAEFNKSLDIEFNKKFLKQIQKYMKEKKIDKYKPTAHPDKYGVAARLLQELKLKVKLSMIPMINTVENDESGLMMINYKIWNCSAKIEYIQIAYRKLTENDDTKDDELEWQSHQIDGVIDSEGSTSLILNDNGVFEIKLKIHWNGLMAYTNPICTKVGSVDLLTIKDSTILTKNEVETLNKMLNENLKKKNEENIILYLVYRMSRDEAKNVDKYKNMGETVTIINTTKYGDCVCGGYTSISWSNKDGYKSDENAFLFTLRRNEQMETNIFRPTDINQAVHHQDWMGASFGDGDLKIFKDGKITSLEKKIYNLPSKAMVGNNQSTVTEYEVYKILHEAQ